MKQACSIQRTAPEDDEGTLRGSDCDFKSSFGSLPSPGIKTKHHDVKFVTVQHLSAPKLSTATSQHNF